MGTRTITVNSAWLLKPAGSDSLNKADDEMRAERAAFQERISEEHYFDLSGTQTSHGIHKPGSAVALVTAAPPAYRLDGTSRFTTTLDKGRLCIDATDGRLTYLDTANGSGTDVWKYVNPGDAPGDFDVGGDLTVGTDGSIGRDLTVGRNLDVDADVDVGGGLNVVGGISSDTATVNFGNGDIRHAYFLATATQAEVFTFFSPIIPNVNDTIYFLGWGGTTGLYTAVRTTTTKVSLVITSGATSLPMNEGNATQLGYILRGYLFI